MFGKRPIAAVGRGVFLSCKSVDKLAIFQGFYFPGNTGERSRQLFRDIREGEPGPGGCFIPSFDDTLIDFTDAVK
jgi:hypothetical protein